MTDHGSVLSGKTPLNLKTSLANKYQTKPIDGLPLLLTGMATSTYSDGESMSVKAMTGMLTYEDSLMAWKSVLGSVTMTNLGSLKERVM